MQDDPHYTLDDDMEEAEAAARDLPRQIRQLRDRVRQARADLSSGRAGSGEQNEP